MDFSHSVLFVVIRWALLIESLFYLILMLSKSYLFELKKRGRGVRFSDIFMMAYFILVTAYVIFIK